MPSIAIVGAGPSGLVLGSLLHRNNIPYTIFELRPKPSSSLLSEPSSCLDLHGESGQRALEACGLLAKFKDLTGDCSEDFILTDKHGVVQHSDDGQGGNRPEIARAYLTDLLFSSVPQTNIQWQQRVTAIKQADGQKWSIEFEGRESKTFDLVIGADGAWSKIRPALTDVRPHASGVHCIRIMIREITTRHPKLATLLGKGTFSATGDKKALMCQRGSQDSALVLIILNSNKENYFKDTGLDSLSADEMQQKLVTEEAYFGTWGEGLKDVIQAGFADENGEIWAKPLYMLPTTHIWEHVPGVTLVGDAAHLMTPFSGEGVNAAMLDAVELAEQIIETVKTGDSLSKAVEEYEKKMFLRAKDNAEESWNNLNMIFAEDAPRGFVQFFLSHGQPPE